MVKLISSDGNGDLSEEDVETAGALETTPVLQVSADPTLDFDEALIKLNPPASGGEVQDERLTYDLPEVHPVPLDDHSIDVELAELSPPPIDETILAVLLEAQEIYPPPAEALALDIQILDEVHSAPLDASHLVISLEPLHPVAGDEVQLDVQLLDELVAAPVEDVTGTQAVFQIDELQPAAFDETAIEIDLDELVPPPLDPTTVEIETQPETSAAPVDDVTGTETVFLVLALVPTPTDDGATVLEARVETDHSAAADENVISVSGETWPGAIETQSTTGSGVWLNTGNMIDKNAASIATLRVESGGLGGLTSRSGTGTLDVSIIAPLLTDLTITSVVLEWGWSCGRAGSATGLLGDDVNLAEMRYSTDDGAGYTVFATKTGNITWNEQNQQLDITSVIGGDWNKIDQFRVRCFADLTSGSGVITPAQRNCNFFNAKLLIGAQKNYG